MYVCLCHGITERAVREAVSQGARTLDDLAARTGCGTCCGCCRDVASSIVEEHTAGATLGLRLIAA